MGVTPPTPFVTSIETDFASIEHRTHVCASTFKSCREFVRFEKVFFSCIFRQCQPGVLLLDAAKQLKMGQFAKWSGPTSFPALYSKHFEPTCFENRSSLHILTWRENGFSKTWRHTNNFFQLVGKSKKAPERRDEPKAALFCLKK